MKEIDSSEKYKFIGYVSDDKRFGFYFVIPVFKLKKEQYRFIVNDVVISKFSAVSVEKKYFVSKKHKLTLKVGDMPSYMFVYQKQLFMGTKEELTPKLRELLLLNEKKFSCIHKYDVAFFLEDADALNESIKEMIKKYPKLKLTSKNFVKPEDFK